jgi:WD40 repeat protein
MQDTRVHIFSMPEGKLIHSLKGHTEAIHVLLAHPIFPSVAISAAYSGEVVVWDVVQGIALRTLDSKTTRPGGRSWPEGFPFVDGFISRDGIGFGLTDAAGQLHLYG